MSEGWKCKCGCQNTLYNRYCVKCHSEIDESVIEAVFTREYKATKHKIKTLKINRRRELREDEILKHYLKPVTLAITFMLIVGSCWYYFSGAYNTGYIHGKTHDLTYSVKRIKLKPVLRSSKKQVDSQVDILKSKADKSIENGKTKLNEAFKGIITNMKIQEEKISISNTKERLEELINGFTK